MNPAIEPENNPDKGKKVEPLVLPPILEPTPIVTTGEGTTPPVTPAKEEVVKEIRAKVDLTQKPTEMNEPISLLDDDEFFKNQTKPTEGDLKQKEEDKRKADLLKEKLSSSNSSSSSSSPNSSTTPKPPLTADKRQKQADKWVKALDLLNTWGMKKWSGQADDIGLKTLDTDKEALAEALADVMEEYNFNPAPLLTLAITTVAVFGNTWSNAYESRQKIRAFRKENPEKVKEADNASVKIKPELDPSTGKHQKRRGGQFKN